MKPNKYVTLADIRALQSRFEAEHGMWFGTTGIPAIHVWNHEDGCYWVLHPEECSECFQCKRPLTPDQRKGEIAGGLCAECYQSNCDEVRRKYPEYGDGWLDWR